MLNLLVFAVIGLLAGTAARLLYPGREPMRILGTLVLGMAGALAGGLISYSFWPAVEDQFQVGNLVLSILGAAVAIVFWAGVAYARSISASQVTSR